MTAYSPRVAVVIPAYNAEAFLARAIRSAVEQCYENKEILVVDDGSLDGTRCVVENFGQAVQYVWQEHSGQAAATNLGIQESSGDFIALLDADDEWLPGRLEQTVLPMVGDEGIGLCYCLATLCSPDGSEKPRPSRRRVRRRAGGLYWPERVCVPAVTLRRSVLEQVGLFDESMPHYNDHDLFLRVAEVTRIHEVPEFLVRVFDRQESQQHSYSTETVVEMYLRVFFKALGRATGEYDRDVTLSRAYAGAAVRLWREGFRLRGLKYALASCVLKPDLREMVGLAKGFAPRLLVRTWSGIKGRTVGWGRGREEGED